MKNIIIILLLLSPVIASAQSDEEVVAAVANKYRMLGGSTIQTDKTAPTALIGTSTASPFGLKLVISATDVNVLGDEYRILGSFSFSAKGLDGPTYGIVGYCADHDWIAEFLFTRPFDRHGQPPRPGRYMEYFAPLNSDYTYDMSHHSVSVLQY